MYHGRESNSGGKFLLALLLCAPFLIWGGVRVKKAIVFKIQCSDHLKRAADANTIELARQEMKVVIDYLEKNGLTEGYTSVLYKSPDEDVGFWYKNLKAAFQELENVKPEATQLERTNVLMKLRETLVDQGESVQVTEPSGISVYPSNSGYAVWGMLGLLCLFGLGYACFCWESED